jgi:hypothetical protein
MQFPVCLFVPFILAANVLATDSITQLIDQTKAMIITNGGVVQGAQMVGGGVSFLGIASNEISEVIKDIVGKATAIENDLNSLLTKLEVSNSP